MKPLRRQRGTALILVLWLVVALSLVVAAGANSVRGQAQRMAIDLDRMRAEAVLDGAVQVSVQRLMGPEKAETGRYRLLRMQMGERTVWIETIPAVGLVDINVASEALLQALFQRVGRLSPGEATIMASRVRDFIDADDTPSGVGGAEAPQYRAAGKTVMPRNEGLDDLTELRSVLGMTAELYEIISPYLGINGQQRIAADSAPPALIDALTGQKGLGVQFHQTPPESRAALLQVGAAAELFLPGQNAGEQTVKIRAYLQDEGDRWWLREGWFDLGERPDTLTPWTTLSMEATKRVNKPEQEFNP